jgi:hypothetical protein
MQAALPLMIGGKLLQGVAGMRAGQFNSQLLRGQAQEALMMGTAEELQMRDAARATMVSQLGAMAESGFTIGEGSALGAIQESLISREVDAMNIRRNAMGRAAGLRAQAAQERQRGRMAMLDGVIGAAGAIAGYKADYAAAAGTGAAAKSAVGAAASSAAPGLPMSQLAMPSRLMNLYGS